MEVKRDRVVRFHYIIRDEPGDAAESTRDGEPLAILHGRGDVMRGIEDALTGHRAGDQFQVTLAPEQARSIPRSPGQPENRGLTVFKKD